MTAIAQPSSAEIALHQLAEFILGSGVAESGAIDELLSQPMLQLAAEQGVRNLLFDTVVSGNGAAGEYAGFAKQQAFAQIAAEMVQRAELQEITRLLSPQLKFLYFKGSPLAYAVYPEPQRRQRGDTDVLFSSREDADKAFRLLQARGYRKVLSLDADLISAEFSCYRDLAGGNLSVVDMHWRTNNAVQFRSLGFEELYEKAVAVPELGDGAVMPSLVHGFILACQHRLAHASEGQENRLIWLYDLHLLSQRMSSESWADLIALAEKYSLAECCLSGIDAATRYWHTRVPDGVYAALAALAEGNLQNAAVPSSLLLSDWQQFTNQRGLNKIRFLWQHLFPPAAYMRAKYRPRNGVALFYSYLTRIFGGLRKRLCLPSKSTSQSAIKNSHSKM